MDVFIATGSSRISNFTCHSRCSVRLYHLLKCTEKEITGIQKPLLLASPNPSSALLSEATSQATLGTKSSPAKCAPASSCTGVWETRKESLIQEGGSIWQAPIHCDPDTALLSWKNSWRAELSSCDVSPLLTPLSFLRFRNCLFSLVLLISSDEQ